MPAADFPSGWPVRCPACEGTFAFRYVSDRTGNVRRYRCHKCGVGFLATWKGKPIRSCLAEPRNTSMEKWDWARIVEGRELPPAGALPVRDEAIEVEAVVVDVPEMTDGTPAAKELVELYGPRLAGLLEERT